MELPRKPLDDLGPEKVAYLNDPRSGMRAVHVIHNSAMGPAAGGVRMLPDISVEEICDLAKVMTYKCAIFDLRCGGAKAGVWTDRAAQNGRELISAFARAVKPYVAGGLYIP